ncbi:SH3 domain-containing protein [Kibdelosporangium philippinense]|uniref:SH3 domain-containing protein n=1 Tax=Kibdelosporangium philippinense TaxID=211113 RepID=UPI0036238676
MVTKLWARAREVIVLAPKRTLIVVAVLVGVVILYVLGSEKQQNGGANNANAPATTACRVAVTADVLNVRALPDGKSPIVGKFRLKAEADAEKTVQNGFRKLSEGRWVSNEYVQPLPGRDC